MNVILYKNLSDNNVINKDITQTHDLQCTFEENVTQSQPVIKIRYDSIRDFQTVHRSNYFYLANTGRYYYINDIEMCKGNIIKIHGVVDVLMSFRDFFKDNEFYIKRISNKLYRNKDIVDGSCVVENKNILQCRKIETNFFIKNQMSDNYILQTVGGV